MESFYTTRRQRKIDRFSVHGFRSHCNTVFELRGCFLEPRAYQKLHPFLTEEGIKHDSKKRELCELRRSDIQEKCFFVVSNWECE